MKKLAIVGSGIAGMSCAYFLDSDYEVTLFEKNDYIGGHTNTIDVYDGKKKCPMDTGFMVFNEYTYPNLVKLFKKLDVEYVDTDMSFSVRNDLIDLEFNGSSLGGIFSQRKNLLNFKFVKMVFEILKFNKKSVELLNDNTREISIDSYLKELGLSDYFFTNFLAPMSSAVWSTPMDKIRAFPARALIQFFKNHGFVGVNTQLQWKTVKGGSRSYRDKILDSINASVIHSKVLSVSEEEGKVCISTADDSFEFDKVIMASHADETLSMLKNPTSMQKDVLSKFLYQKNIAVVHTDKSVMPNLKENWSSWNFMMKEDKAYTVYYMNRLQGVSDEVDFFININGEEFVDESQILQKFEYHHPVFNVDAYKAQKKIDQLNKESNIHFAGSYYRYGFHEDALLSGVNLSEYLLGKEVL